MEKDKVIFNTLFAVFMSTLLCACAVKFTPQGKTFPPYTGDIKVIWKEPGIVPNPDSYDLIGTVTGRVILCGAVPGWADTDLHNRLIKETRKYGGNGIILSCGAMGAEDECKCYGDIIRFKSRK